MTPRKRGPGRPKKNPEAGEAIAPEHECGGCERVGTRDYRGVPWCGRSDCALFIQVYGTFLGRGRPVRHSDD